MVYYVAIAIIISRSTYKRYFNINMWLGWRVGGGVVFTNALHSLAIWEFNSKPQPDCCSLFLSIWIPTLTQSTFVKLFQKQVEYFPFSAFSKNSYIHISGFLFIWMYTYWVLFDPYPFLSNKTLIFLLFLFQKQLCFFISQTEKAYSTYIF